MNKILIVSLRASGSHYLWRMLSDQQIPFLQNSDETEDLLRGHIQDNTIERIREWADKGYKLIIPVRPIEDIAKSWKGRRYVVDYLPRHVEYARSLPGLRVDIKNPDFDAIEKYVGFTVNRDTSKVKDPNSYPPAKSVAEYADLIKKIGEGL